VEQGAPLMAGNAPRLASACTSGIGPDCSMPYVSHTDAPRFVDEPALCELTVMGLCRPARYLPSWASDLRSLLALLTYSTFMNRIDPAPMMAVARKILEHAPVVEFPDQT
jgi:hypothetical protein